MTEFEVQTEQIHDGAILLTVVGEVDLFTAPEFDRHLRASLDGGASAVIVDLSQCEFFDSSGLGVLARANHRHNGAVTVSLIVPDESLHRRTLEITQLDRMFRIYSERRTALAAAEGR